MVTHKKEIIWTAPEFKYHQKDVSWYWLSILAAAVIILISLWLKNFLFAIFVVIAEIVLISWAKRQPKNIKFGINEKGISIGEAKFYEYKELKGFFLKEGPAARPAHLSGQGPEGELILKTNFKIEPYIKIFVFNGDIPEIKSFLKNHLEEIEYTESLHEAISKIIKF